MYDDQGSRARILKVLGIIRLSDGFDES